MNILKQSETLLLVSDYLTRLQSQDIRPATISKYRQCLDNFISFLRDDPITEESARLFLNHLKSRGYTNATIRIYYHAIRPFLDSQGIRLKAKFKKRKTLPPYHSANQVRALLDVVEKRKDNFSYLAERDYLIILMLAYTGIRRSELLSIKLSDINFDSNMLRVRGKGDNDRTIPIAAVMRDRLKVYMARLKHQDLLFPIKGRRVCSIINLYASRAGIYDLHPHSFRHFFATQLVEQGVALNVIRDLLGHADISTTAIYLDVLPRHLEAAVSSLPDLRG